MTDTPKIGFLCTGKTPLELSVSVHTANKMMDFLRKAGFMNGAGYTEIFKSIDANTVKRAGQTLKQLCYGQELVFTVGCEGFAKGDVMPDITEVVCPQKATYFESVLCGAKEVISGDTPLPGNPEERHPLRLYSDDGEQEFSESDTSAPAYGQDTLAARIDNALKKISRQKEHADAQTQPSAEQDRRDEEAFFRHIAHRQKRHGQPPFPSNRQRLGIDRSSENTTRAKRFLLPPSRATAGIFEKTLVLNVSNDSFTVLPLLKSLVPALYFAVYNLSGKSAISSLAFEKQLKNSSNFHDTITHPAIVND